MAEDSQTSLIYGLELQGRALSAVTADSDNVSFMVGTQTLKSDNFVYLVNLDEDTGQLNKRVLKHPAGEVWNLDPSPTDPALFLSTYGEKKTSNYGEKTTSTYGEKTTSTYGEKTTSTYWEKTSSTWRKKAAVWKIPNNKSGLDGEEGSVPSVELSADLTQVSGEGEMVGAWFQPSDHTKLVLAVGDKVALVDLQHSAQPNKIWESQHTVRGQTRIETSRWNPHRGCHQISTVCGSQIIAWDTRTGERAWNINVNSGSAIRSLDFNHNKQYILCSGGDDGTLSTWDCREPSKPLYSTRAHSHWVWSLRYNSFHDQLLLSAGSDSRVLLHSQASLSSEPYRQNLEDEEDQEKILEDGLLQTYYDHEDSVYTAEWSVADPWTFASLSYDGRLVIGHVPKYVKYRILNLG